MPLLFASLLYMLFHHVLEIGSVIGITTEEILKRLPLAKLTALDYDASQLERAKARLAKKYGKQGDATALQFPAESFDAVFEFNVFHHIRDYHILCGNAEAITIICRAK